MMSAAHVRLVEEDEPEIYTPSQSSEADGNENSDCKAIGLFGLEDVPESPIVVPESVKEEAKALIKIAAPMMLAFVMNMAVRVTTFICIGHLNRPELMGGAGLAQMTINITGWAIVIGLLSAQETLSAQAYGAKNNRRIGYLWLRAQAVTFVSLAPMGFVWWNIQHILTSLKQDPEVAMLAGDYARPMITAIPAYVLLETTRRFLTAQQITRPIAITSLIGGIVHLGLCPAMTFWAGWGMAGAVWSLAFTMWFSTIMLLIAARFSGAYTNGTWPTREDFPLAFKGWIEFYKLGLPGVGMMAGEWIGYEVAAFLAGLLGTIQIATHNVITQTIPIVFMISLGMCTAAAMRIGSFLGAGRPDAAKRTARVALAIVVIVVGLLALLTVLGRGWLATIFTTNEEVLDKASIVFLAAALFMVVDNIQGTLAGIIRGMGVQAWATPASLLGCYGVALPLAILFAFKFEWDLLGIWMGMSAGWATLGLLSLIIIIRSNWDRLSEKARHCALKDSDWPASPSSPRQQESTEMECVV